MTKPARTQGDATDAALGGIDDEWEAAAPPDPLATATARPPPLVGKEPLPFSEPTPADIDHAEQEIEPDEPKIDIAAASRAANTAAALGRAPKPHLTTKIKAFQLAEALARSTALEDDDKKKG